MKGTIRHRAGLSHKVERFLRCSPTLGCAFRIADRDLLPGIRAGDGGPLSGAQKLRN